MLLLRVLKKRAQFQFAQQVPDKGRQISFTERQKLELLFFAKLPTPLDPKLVPTGFCFLGSQ